MPVFAVGSSNDVDHVLCRVGSWWAGSIISTEVISDGRRIVTDVTKVNSLTALGEQQECVELSKEEGGRLVDGDQDGLANISKLAKETNSIECGLTIQSS